MHLKRCTMLSVELLSVTAVNDPIKKLSRCNRHHVRHRASCKSLKDNKCMPGFTCANSPELKPAHNSAK